MFYKTHLIWIKVFENHEVFLSRVPENKIIPLQIDELAIAVSNDAGKLVAFDQVCPHQKASLLKGECFDGKVICPWHKYSFSCENGRDLTTGGDVLKVYPAKLDKESWYIGIEKRLPFWMDPA